MEDDKKAYVQNTLHDITTVPIGEKLEIPYEHTKQIWYNAQRCAELPEDKNVTKFF